MMLIIYHDNKNVFRGGGRVTLDQHSSQRALCDRSAWGISLPPHVDIRPHLFYHRHHLHQHPHHHNHHNHHHPHHNHHDDQSNHQLALHLRLPGLLLSSGSASCPSRLCKFTKQGQICEGEKNVKYNKVSNTIYQRIMSKQVV